MKKILRIEFIDDRKPIERDITLEHTAPIGAPANDAAYGQICLSIAANGYTDTENTSAKQYTHIAPSQIKTVSIIFQE